MQNTFYDGDFVFVSRFCTTVGLFNRFDIVICNNPDRDTQVIKRLVGMPGDNIQITDGDIYINGEKLVEDYLVSDYTYGEIDINLSDKEYFILGDNRSISYDSRGMGPIHKDDIQGKVILRFFPPTSFEFFIS